jgi:hypothetical protein
MRLCIGKTRPTGECRTARILTALSTLQKQSVPSVNVPAITAPLESNTSTLRLCSRRGGPGSIFSGRFTQNQNVRVRKLPWGEVKVVPELIATPCGFENFPRVDHEPNSAKPTLGGSRGHGSGPGVTPRYGARPSHVAHAARSDARVTSLSSQLKQLVILSGLIIGPNYRVKIRVLQYIRTRITLSKYGIPSRSSRTNSSYGACSGHWSTSVSHLYVTTLNSSNELYCLVVSTKQYTSLEEFRVDVPLRLHAQNCLLALLSSDRSVLRLSVALRISLARLSQISGADSGHPVEVRTVRGAPPCKSIANLQEHSFEC